MTENITAIGGADGSTSFILAGEAGNQWFSVFGIIIVILLLLPNCIYAIKNKDQKNKCSNKIMNITEQIGRYGCMVLMIFSIGIKEFGFSSVEAFLIYLFGNAMLLIVYWIVWGLYFYKKCFWKEMVLSIIPACIFLLSGLSLEYYLLVLFAVIFAYGHIHMTVKNK